MAKNRKIRKQTKVWTTKDGRKIRVCDMSDNHLANTIRMHARLFKSYLMKCQMDICAYLSNDPPDGASMCAENEITQIDELIREMLYTPDEPETINDFIDRSFIEPIQKKYPILTSMIYEVRRRESL